MRLTEALDYLNNPTPHASKYTHLDTFGLNEARKMYQANLKKIAKESKPKRGKKGKAKITFDMFANG